jgi:hypothetical protein
MRAAFWFALTLLSASAVQAGDLSVRPPLLTKPPSDGSVRALTSQSDGAPLMVGRPRPHENLPLLGPQRPMPTASNSGFSIGPFHADTITRYSRSGKAHLAPHYSVSGMTLLGGTIGGSVDGRGGMLTLNWHTAP